MSTNSENSNLVKKSFWIASVFYIVIAFEFFYMVSPFAIYFYSVYEPGLSFISRSSSLGWLSSTFLPHFVANSSSGILMALQTIGAILCVGGILAFLVGITQSNISTPRAMLSSIFTGVPTPIR